MPADIVLTGPVRTGKSTPGKMLAEKLGLPQETCREILGRVSPDT